jgi:hypothetical protein
MRRDESLNSEESERTLPAKAGSARPDERATQMTDIIDAATAIVGGKRLAGQQLRIACQFCRKCHNRGHCDTSPNQTTA